MAGPRARGKPRGAGGIRAPRGRRAQRVTLHASFESFDAFVRDYVANVSRTGVFLRADDPLPVGTEVNLRFTVVMDDIETITGVGEVVRVQNDPPGMGVVFTKLDACGERVLGQLLTRRER